MLLAKEVSKKANFDKVSFDALSYSTGYNFLRDVYVPSCQHPKGGAELGTGLTYSSEG